MNIDKLLSRLQEEFSKESQYSFELKKRFEKYEEYDKYSEYSVDLAIMKSNHVIMVISQAANKEEEEKHFYHYHSFCPEADYYVVLRGGKLICMERPYSKEDCEELNKKFSFGNTLQFSSIEKKECDIEKIIHLIKHGEELHQITAKELQNFLTEQTSKFGINLTPVIETVNEKNFGYNNHEVWLSFNVEVLLITALLNDKGIPSSVYRYTSSETLNRLFNNDEKYHSMSSLVTMNDTTEMDYTNNYLKKAGVDISTEKQKRERNDSVHAYITSLTDLKDDLTMWRLYGDQAKGICIEYEVPMNIQSSGFILARVSYADESKKDNKLDFIASLMKNKLKGHRFVLKGWYGWQHFFKPKEYSVEREIRLLAYINDLDFTIEKYGRKWITTKEGILAPLLLLSLKAKNEDKETVYPLLIKGVILGSKFIEKEANRITWDYKITDECSDCVSHNFHTSTSNIDNYR